MPLRNAVLVAFALLLVLCVALGRPVALALAACWALFSAYALHEGFSVRDVCRMSSKGIRQIGPILLSLAMIGMLTASWRASGTIAVIVSDLSTFVNPGAFLLFAFLSNAFLSVLMGTSFGTAATMGVVAASLGASFSVPSLLTAGAVMSGIYFGDRWSPMSTSALLTAAVTGTRVRQNLPPMLARGTPAFILAAALYFVLGLWYQGSGEVPDIAGLFSSGFRLDPLCWIPALLVVLLVLFRIGIRMTIAVSIASAFLLAVFLQGLGPMEVVKALLFGYESRVPHLRALMDGGGAVSFALPITIMVISGTYAGLFEGTGLLGGIEGLVRTVAKRVSVFASILFAAAGACMVSCNQSFAIMLLSSLARGVRPDRQRLALDIEDSVITVAALIPWSVAAAVPLTVLGVGPAALPLAFFLWLLPLSRLLLDRGKL